MVLDEVYADKLDEVYADKKLLSPRFVPKSVPTDSSASLAAHATQTNLDPESVLTDFTSRGCSFPFSLPVPPHDLSLCSESYQESNKKYDGAKFDGAKFDATKLASPYRALYIHIPFCASRCVYCDFATEVASADDPRIDAYLETIIREIEIASREGLLAHIETIYIGGGTPSHIGTKRLVKLICALSHSIRLTNDIECTLEANPESINARLVRDVCALGLNRFSLGVQSFNDNELRRLGRAHNARQARDAIKVVQEHCDNVSLDLICGIPGQDVVSWKASIDAALAFDLTHLSVYPLTVEDDTPLVSMIERGLVKRPNEDLQAEMMLYAEKSLHRAGFRRYEVASYARNKSYQSRHNKAYWTGVPYLGIGEHAASMRMTLAGRERLQGGQLIETLRPLEAALEDIMLGMRLTEGVSQQRVAETAKQLPALIQTFAELETLGLVKSTPTRYVPTTRGWLLGNELYTRILALFTRNELPSPAAFANAFYAAQV